MTSTKLIRGEALPEELATWEAPEVQGIPPGHPVDPDVELENLRREARQQGFEEGRKSGFEAGRQDVETRSAALESVLNALARPLEDLDHKVEEELLALVKTIARLLVRREMHLDPTHLVAVIREGLAALPLASENLAVLLHPDDAAVIRDCLNPDKDDRPWHIQADPTLERGGCLIVSAESQVDGRLETRLGRAIATLFEDEREDPDD